MTAEEFKILCPEDLAKWFKYHSAQVERDGIMLFKDTGAKLHYDKNKRIYDNVYSCLVNEKLDVKGFVDQYFQIPGKHSPEGLQTVAERKCMTFYKNIRRGFAKTVKNMCDAMAKKNTSSSLDVLKTLGSTRMLAPNFLAGRISVFWLAGIHDLSDIPGLNRSITNRRGSSIIAEKSLFSHRDDFDFTFNTFLEQKEVYYHQLCLAFGGVERGGIDSIAVTDRQFAKRIAQQQAMKG